MTRQIVLDTETTGLEVGQGHRVIEVGCVELRSRRTSGNNFHRYLNPERDSEVRALEVHGLTLEFLADKPRFAQIAPDLLDYLRGAELIIHNASFDVGFLNAELARAGIAEKIEQICTVTDTVQFARQLHPGQKVNLDALCKRYGVDNSRRDLHGALLDARLLADVYLAMTSGQDALSFGVDTAQELIASSIEAQADVAHGPLVVVIATVEELTAHRERLAWIVQKSTRCLWPGETESDQPPARHNRVLN